MTRDLFGLTFNNKKIKIGEYDDGSKYVGGRIFYIDPNSDETVEFYNANGDVISNVAVGDTPYAYKVTDVGTSGKEKYYIYNESLSNSKLKWGFNNITTGATYTDIGKGKTNSEIALALEDTSASSGTIWHWIKNLNSTTLNSCSDWYIGSSYEMKALQNNAESLGIQSWFTDECLWSSTEVNHLYAYYWSKFITNIDSGDKPFKFYTVAIRSF